jgi:hypothetical protein
MSPELKQLCTLLGASLPIGLLIGLFLRKTEPEWCKSYTKFCLDRKWWVFLTGLLLFITLGAISFVRNRPYFGWFFTAFALLEAYCLVKFGFRPLSPEMAAKIDASDPTRIFSKAPSDHQDEPAAPSAGDKPGN